MEKQVAITILEDIYNSLQGNDWKEKRIRNNRYIQKELRNSYERKNKKSNRKAKEIHGEIWRE